MPTADGVMGAVVTPTSVRVDCLIGGCQISAQSEAVAQLQERQQIQFTDSEASTPISLPTASEQEWNDLCQCLSEALGSSLASVVNPTASPTAAASLSPTLAPGAKAVAIVDLKDSRQTARLRDAPNGALVDQLPVGTLLQVLNEPITTSDGTVWLQVVVGDGPTQGWIAKELIRVIAER